MAIMQSGYGLQTKHIMMTTLEISGFTMCYIFQNWLDFQTKQKKIMTTW